MREVLVNRLGGLSLPWKSVVRLTDRPDMILGVYRGRKTTTQQQQQSVYNYFIPPSSVQTFLSMKYFVQDLRYGISPQLFPLIG